MTRITKALERFDEKKTVLFTQGGLCVLLDYPPHDRVLDEKAVKAFLASELSAQLQEVREAMPEERTLNEGGHPQDPAVAHEEGWNAYRTAALAALEGVETAL